MEKPSRKPNRMIHYNYSLNGAYFVTVCTRKRRHILSEIVGDGFPVPKACGKIAEEFLHRIPARFPAVSVDNYVIMPDHLHLLLRIENAPDGTGNPSPTLGNVMGWYKYQVTKQVNLILGTPGQPLFQRSYYDHVIRNQQDYDEIWEYIENNPTKWMWIHDPNS